jgi:signal peptidase I
MQSIVQPDSSAERDITLDENDEGTNPPDTRPQTGTIWRNLTSLAEVGVMLLILVGLYNVFISDAQITGASMTPALQPDQRVLASRFTYALFPPVRGDVVVLRDPLNSERVQVRRVIGLPGERVELRGRQVLINGQPLNEDYIGNALGVSDNLTATSQVLLPANQYYALGDNRLSINDSRSWGPIPADDILGRAWLLYWPPENFGVIKGARYGQTTGADQ